MYVTSGSDQYVLNLAKDLSAKNMKGFAQTTTRGVPLVYDVTIQATGGGSAAGGSVSAWYTVPNTWMYRNGAVKLHYAREKQFANMEIDDNDRGRYDETIRYTWFDEYKGAGSSTWEVMPLHGLNATGGSSAALQGGEWDYTQILTNTDSGGFFVKLIGKHDPVTVDEENTFYTMDAMSLVPYYLNSRRKVPSDDPDIGPADHNIHDQILMAGRDSDELQDNMQILVDDQADQPPYAYGDEPHWIDFTRPTLVGSTNTFDQVNSTDTIRLKAPFGLIATTFVLSGSNQTIYTVKVNSIKPMVVK